MSNSYFKFKQFTIHQDSTAMKVGTDGVLLGTWVTIGNAERILDIGTGTGLLALMLAQRNTQAVIDAMEIDALACRQAQLNVRNSPWPERINMLCSSFQKFSKEYHQRYDLIVSNPPYFNNSLKSPVIQRNIARHSDSLSYIDLITGVKKLLKDSGRLAVVLPVDEGGVFIRQSIENGLYCCRRLNVKPNANKPVKRVLLEFANQTQSCSEQTLCIETGEHHNYTPEYKALTKDFYLMF
ncbi:MAG: methyltransferase [Prevotellaceae bacterium]|nr:methyltransferase [Prevotellaceae bacterium]